MLSLDQRELFLKALWPPEGYKFDRGLGTTFTLDLQALMMVPLALTLQEVGDTESVLVDPVLLLDGLQRYAERLTLFCQSGRIAIPPPENYLYRFLENMVVPVTAPNGGVFHPKIWVLRYISDERPVFYRLLSLSRNLTFDRSWDLMLRMDGFLSDRKYAYSRNNPLGDFIAALPEMAVHPASESVRSAVEILKNELRCVDFKVPWPFEQDYGFHPAGITSYPGYRFQEGYWNVLVMAPFLSDRLLGRVAASGSGSVLISRPESIAALRPDTRSRFGRLFVLDDALPSGEDTDPVEDVGEEIRGLRTEPNGLHAKLFILEAGWYATWLLGSSNATNAAFWRKNVEFLVSLKGKRSKIGIEQVLGPDQNSNSLLSMLQPFSPGGMPDARDPDEIQAEEVANHVRDWLSSLDLSLQVGVAEGDAFDLQLEAQFSEDSVPVGEYTISCWPVTWRFGQAVRWDLVQTQTLAFHGLSILALTPFVAFAVEGRAREKRYVLRFVLRVPIRGLPAGRDDHLFSAILSNRSNFARYLLLVLGGGGEMITLWNMNSGTAERDSGGGRSWEDSFPLLEVILRALSQSPEKIDQVNELVTGLRRVPDGNAIIPEGFETLWDAVIATRRKLT